MKNGSLVAQMIHGDCINEMKKLLEAGIQVDAVVCDPPYLSVVIDLYSRRVIGWSVQARQTTELVLQALLMAVWRRKPKTKVLYQVPVIRTHAPTHEGRWT